MPVAVVRADGDQRDPSRARGEEGGIGVAAAVVRDLEHVGAQVGAVGEDPGLRLGAEVAGEQDAQPPGGDPDDQREVVGLGAGRRPPGPGREHLDLRTTDRSTVTGNEHRPLRAVAADQLLEGRHAVVGRGERAGGDGADLAPGQRSGKPGRVVGVQVRHQDQRQRVDAQPVQAPVDGPHVRTGVDEHARPRPGRQDEGVALPDVAGHDDGVRRRPAACDLTHRPAQEDQADEGGQCQRS
jgi:hypothetical protein